MQKSEKKILKRIVVVGPESTGKSTLCQQLAERYQTAWVPEYAREYLLDNGMDYDYDDLLTIAKGQVALENKIENDVPPAPGDKDTLLFVDTNMYVMQVWCEFVFEKCHSWILDQIVERPYHLYLLCNIDLPWVKDELREYPNIESRNRLYHIYRQIMISQDVPWVEITGLHEQRFDLAKNAIDKFFIT